MAMTRREMGTRVAILTAIERAVKRQREDARAELDRELMRAHEEDGVSGFDLFVGDEKVGRLYTVKPSAGVLVGSQFRAWAMENGHGRTTLTVDVSHAPQTVLDRLNEVMDRFGLPHEYEQTVDDDLKKTLEVRGNAVVDRNGEVVPGTYVRENSPRIRDCKPETVGAALAVLQARGEELPTIAGLLEGGE